MRLLIVLAILAVNREVYSLSEISDCQYNESLGKMTLNCLPAKNEHLFDGEQIILCGTKTFNKSIVTTIDFFNCVSPTIPMNLFENYPNLRTFDLSNKQMTKLLPFNRIGNQLEILNLSANRMSRLEISMFDNLDELKRLQLSHNQFKEIPPVLFYKTEKLIDIDVSFNQIQEIHELAFAGAFKLEKLNLAFNNLTDISPKIFDKQVNLMELDMSHNQLLSLDDDIFSETKQLTVLKLSNNRLTNITRLLLSGLVHLRKLYLDNNNLHTIHMTAFEETALQVLHLQNNHLAFDNFGEEHWDVERSSPFQSLIHLEELIMRNNSITKFLNDWHTSNVALKSLDLSYNQIAMINFRFIFNNWTHSIRINVSHNRITTMNAAHNFTLIKSRNKIEWILNSNPLKCDCLLIHFAKALRNQTLDIEKSNIKLIANELKCASPKQYINVHLKNVPLSKFICPLHGFQCPERCICFVRTDDGTVIYNCSNANLNKVPTLSNINRYLGLPLKFHELYIENNNITTLPMNNATGYKNINRIYARNNSLATISLEQLPNNLFTFDVSANRLQRIDLDVLIKLGHMQNLQNISFGQNPWICDCTAYELMNYIKTHSAYMVRVNDIICDNDKSMSLIDANGLCPIDIKTIGIIIITFVAVILFVTMYYYKNQQDIMVWLFANNLMPWIFRKPISDDNKEFDAFILYSSFDQKYIYESLVPQLENGSIPLKICLLEREIRGGDFIMDQISRCVEISRRTVVFLTPNFTENFQKIKQDEAATNPQIDDVWGLMGFRIAHKNALDELRSRVIIVTKGKIGDINSFQHELRGYLKSNIQFRLDEPQFINKLRLAILHPKYFRCKCNLYFAAIKQWFCK